MTGGYREEEAYPACQRSEGPWAGHQEDACAGGAAAGALRGRGEDGQPSTAHCKRTSGLHTCHPGDGPRDREPKVQ